MLGQKMDADQSYEGHGVEDRSCWSRGWEGTERLYGAVGEKSIDFSRIPYRLFPDASVQLLGQPGSNDLFVWEHHSAPIVQSL